MKQYATAIIVHVVRPSFHPAASLVLIKLPHRNVELTLLVKVHFNCPCYDHVFLQYCQTIYRLKNFFSADFYITNLMSHKCLYRVLFVLLFKYEQSVSRANGYLTRVSCLTGSFTCKREHSGFAFIITLRKGHNFHAGT